MACRQKLTEFLIRPILQQISPAISRIYFSGAGPLTNLPWSFFIQNSSRPNLLVSVVDSPRQFVTLPTATNDVENCVLLIGNIEFGDAALSLPGAADEIERIRRIAEAKHFPIETIVSNGATSKRVSTMMPSANFIHFATHGFFISNLDYSAISSSTRSSRSIGFRHGNYSRNPLLLSGLLLAKETDADPVGILTAEEIIGLNLHRCNVVTLSACETGLGRSFVGQGALGLRSAIISAGAQSVLVSLWKVDDAATNLLMSRFYENLWERKLNKATALENAQQAVAAVPEFANPYYWAGWTLIGRGW
jgi:CHAT domain-containing protein